MKLTYMTKAYQSLCEVSFADEKTCSAVYSVVEELQDKFGDDYDKDIAVDLKNAIEFLPYYAENFNLGEFLSLIYRSIKEATCFNDIELPYGEYTEEILYINQRIKDYVK